VNDYTTSDKDTQRPKTLKDYESDKLPKSKSLYYPSTIEGNTVILRDEPALGPVKEDALSLLKYSEDPTNIVKELVNNSNLTKEQKKNYYKN
jgi:hypothetical protein